MSERDTYTEADYDQWWADGNARGWVGPAVCYTHDGAPTTLDEDESEDAETAPPVLLIRMYESPEIADAAEGSDATSEPRIILDLGAGFNIWLQASRDNRWASQIFNDSEESPPMTAEEWEEFEEGDPCIHVIRIYETSEQGAAVEENHSPSQWRKPRAI